MSRFLLSVVTLLGFVSFGFAQKSDSDQLQGTWQITAMMDDGTLVPDDQVGSRFAQDGRLTISGQTIKFMIPGTLLDRTLHFVIDEKASPKTLDLGGAKKTGGKGIYLLSDDVLMICLSEPEAKSRPTDFTARKGEPQILLTLKRVKATDKNSDPQPKEMPPVATRDEELRKTLPGTWGHKNEDWLTMFTLNSDGTFSSRRSYTKKFGKLFNEDVTSSGNWKLAEGVVICTVTASTDKDSRNQVFSYRIRSITATELIAVDQFGQLRREWKTR